MSHMRGMLKRILAVTIWAPGTFGVPPDRYANLYRVVLPILDAAFIYSGIWSIIYGAPSITDYTSSHGGSTIWGIWLLVSSILCLVGVTIPRLFILEALGKSVLAAALVVYIAALTLLTITQGPTRGVVTGLAVGGLLIVLWRLGDIRTERRHRRREHQHDGESTP
jgi:hypothetical protein